MKIGPVGAVAIVSRAALAVFLVTGPIAGSAAPSSSAQDPGTALYVKAGCVACHGVDAGGSKFAPNLPGHTAAQVKHYVRNPQGKMPRFGADKLSDAELDKLASYLASLPVAKARIGSAETLGALEMHHWMAHHALRSNDAKHANHHLSHALDLVKDDEHRRGIERILELVGKNRLEDAAHHTVQMVAAKITPEISMERMHLRLALGSLDAADVREARHHVDHYVEAASAHDKAHATELAAVLKKGDVESAKKRLAHLLAR